MAKVILISSREIDEMLEKFTEKNDYNFIESQNLQEQFFYPSEEGFMQSVLDMNRNQKLIGDFAAFSQMTYKNAKNEDVNYSSTDEIISKCNGFKIPKEAKASILQSIRKLTGKIKIVGSGLVYEGSNKYLGKVVKLTTKDNDVNIFIIHEYPHHLQNNTHTKIAYMNAIVEDIILSNESLKDAEWTFVSHDRDWLGESPKECNIKENLDNNIEIPDNFKLKVIYDKENTAIFVFSHVRLDSNIYGKFIRHFNKETINKLEKFGKTLIQDIIDSND